MSLRPAADSDRGFTLIEVLLAVSLVAVIAAMVFSGLYLTTTAIDRARTSTADEQILRSTLRLMAEELAVSVNQAANPWMGVNAQQDGQPADTMAFLTLGQFRSNNATQESELARVVYTRDGVRLMRLVRRNIYGATDESIDQLELATNLKSFNLRYYDGKSNVWTDEWDGRGRSGGPSAVLIELTVAQEGAEPRTVREWIPIGFGS